jgi:hypothetical protein
MTRLASLAVLLLAFALRVSNLAGLPPGWRDDEVIETTVHAQLIIDGERPLYFIQAEGHEPLYHYLSAGWIALVGHRLFSVRLASAFFGLLTVAAVYRLTRRLFGGQAALLAAALLAVSFWALMYSRVKIRHIAEAPFALLAFNFLFVALKRRIAYRKSLIIASLTAGLFVALALYTYLAALTLLVILLVFSLYLLLIRHERWKHIALTLAVALVLYLPLASAIAGNVQRVSIVGGPLTALRTGDPRPLVQNAISTLAMFGNRGDPEALYNIPGRPVFGLVGFYFFLGGLIISLWRWRDPRYAFLVLWLVGGLATTFASTPPASLGHSITALPATCILAALPPFAIRDTRYSIRFALSALLFLSVAARDRPDYFWRWPSLPEVRYLYKADLQATAQALRGAPPATYVLDGPLSIWDRRAFLLEGVPLASPPRWVRAEWAVVFPPEPATYLFPLAEWQKDSPPQDPVVVEFANGLIFEGWDDRAQEIVAHWRVGGTYRIEEPVMGSSVASPPFPAFVFVHLIGPDGSNLAGSDRFDVDAFSLQPGDRFLQRHPFEAPPGVYRLEIGLYNPVGGERILTLAGRDSVSLGEITIEP